MELLFFAITGILTSCALHAWWFNTDLPVYVTKLARRWGWQKDNKELWPDDITYKFWLRHQWQEWLDTAPIPLPGTVIHGFSCPGCFSLHSGWVSFLLVWFFLNAPWAWLFGLPACSIAWAFPAYFQHVLVAALNRSNVKPKEPAKP